jgi:hypothetical protein
MSAIYNGQTNALVCNKTLIQMLHTNVLLQTSALVGPLYIVN